MEIYFLIIFILIIAALPILTFWDFAVVRWIHERKWLRKRKKHERLTSEGGKTQAIVDKIIKENAQRKEKEEEKERQKEEKIKEMLKQPSLLNILVIRIWQEKIDNAIWPKMVIFGKNMEEKMAIETYGLGEKEFPRNARLALIRLPGFKPFHCANFDELTEKEKEEIEKWIVENYEV